MPSYENFNEYVASYIREKNPRMASRLLKDGKVPAQIAIEIMQSEGVPEDKIRRFEERAMRDGSLEMTYEGAQRIYDKLREVIEQKGGERNDDYLRILDSFDPIVDHDLIATGIFCLVPEIRRRLGNKIESLYKVVLNVGASQKKEYATSDRQKVRSFDDNVLSSGLEGLLKAIPAAETEEDVEYQRRLKVILKKKAEREVFPLFKKDKDAAFELIDKKIEEADSEALKNAYAELRDTYREYEGFELEGVNPDFRDPETGETGVLPSLHQRIGIYGLLKERRFGVFDGCGTGKTAIAALAQPLIEREIEDQGREFRRTVVVCPNPAKKSWKRGLTGGDNERYFADVQDVEVVGGNGRKSKEFLESIRDKKWIVLNYEQLITKINGKTLAEELVEMGVDSVIFDESHHVKSLRTKTSKGAPTISLASRFLANNAEYVCMLTGSPIPDRLDDYSVMYSMLNPETCPNPEDFRRLYEGNPRILYTLFNEKSVRRTSEDINDELEVNPFEELVELTDEQRQLYNHIMEFRPKNWLMQARKALIDPRLVDPEILKRAGVIDSIGHDSSAKYRKLEELLLDEEGPITRGERFVVFSSAFRDGVTQPSNGGLRRRYVEVGVEEEFGDASRLEREVLVEAIERDSSLINLRRKFNEIDNVLASLIEKGYVVVGDEKIEVNLSDDLSQRNVNSYLETYRGLELDISFVNRLRETLKRVNPDYDVGVIDGSVINVDERERTVDRLDEDLIGIVCTTDTGGESLDFTSASYVYLLDEDYTPKTTEQAIARVLRKGQQRKVNVTYLRGEDTLDEALRDYVVRKDITNRIAMDGYPLTEEERKILEDTEGKHFSDLIKSEIRGRSINVFDADIEDINAFDVKQRRRKSGGGYGQQVTDYTTTEAQEVMNRIGRDKFGCWKDPEFVELYMKALSSLSVPIVHRAKICDLVRRASLGEIEFPGRVLSEGSGPSLLYSAYHDLDEVLRRYGFEIPVIVDRDDSRLMLERGSNPKQVLGCMTGRGSGFRDGEFDMVDNESVTLLRNPSEVKSSLLEASRVLRPSGLIELITQNLRFSDEFYSGMERLGFEVLTGKNEGFSLGKEMFGRLRRELGEHYAQAYANKLAHTYLLIGRKVDGPDNSVDSDNFWFTKGAEQEIEGSNVVVKPVSDGKVDYAESENVGKDSVVKRSKLKVRRRALPGEIPGLRRDLEGNAEIEE
ncbi:DEAD/DEAH box helicase family protein [Candidatus Woesearchaeota archaeon]|nr:DEAD/DEAH box helicase family protein [Candidatus Woesearchaeota archaeon]